MIVIKNSKQPQKPTLSPMSRFSLNTIYGQCDKLVVETFISLSHWPST